MTARRARGPALVALLVAALAVLAACGTGTVSAASGERQPEGDAVGDAPAVEPELPVTVESADGRTVTVEDISRIVPLKGHISEVIFALGLGDRVVARDISATHAEVQDLPLVTRAHDVSAEAVLAQRPTLVLVDPDNGPSEAIEQIRSTGVPVVVVDYATSVDEVDDHIRTIAEILGVSEAGERLVADTEARLDAVRREIPEDAGDLVVAFLYLRGSAGVYLIGGPDSGPDSMIEAAGARNAGTELGLENPFTSLTSEALVKAQPDVILLTTTGLESVGGVDGLLEIPGIAQTPAGKARRVITVEDGLLFGFGSRTPDALADLIAELYEV
ncbi:MAG TPA: ABC transporter substrate-binding protein [Acidimicrobiales bacterium]|nr:ABC transporter substrate-binding protein [Acidimicrobiales bacterium]